jgi:uncharacterized membrane protein YgdD (TMEM256/DUF423 family)
MKNLRIAFILLALAVVLGAFGAHALKERLAEDSLKVWNTAVLYHFIHALGIVMVVMISNMGLMSERGTKWSILSLFAGIAFFSGSLYFLSTRDITGLPVAWLGPITPIGGVFFIGGWLIAAFNLKKPAA